MPLTLDRSLAAIAAHSRGLADAARDNLDARVEHCPEWSVADLVWHVTEVHWFWRTIAGGELDAPPDESLRPNRPDDDRLVDVFAAGAGALVETLRGADQGASCWTWASQKDVAFITRHQVQEVMVHHFDAANVRNEPARKELRGLVDSNADLVVDAVDEFLTFSVSNPAHIKENAAPLDGVLWFCGCVTAQDIDASWLINDGTVPGTIEFSHDLTAQTDEAPAGHSVGEHCEPGNLLLWLYGRRSDEQMFGEEPAAVVQRFRALCFTD
ncbi:MAG: maleylpyruvate isomerase N-terminal domain-containing protein [Marmoricola sp.]